MERCSRESQFALNPHHVRVRAAEHAPRGPCRLLERRHSLAEIVERGAFGLHASTATATASYDAEDAERLEREQAPFRPVPPLWVRFLRVVAAALLVVLVQADWTQRKLRDYFLRPLARITNRMSPRGYQTYDWEE